MGYYGINFSVTNLSENFFLNYELTMQVFILKTLKAGMENINRLLIFFFNKFLGFSRVIEIPACIAGIFVIDKIGRRNTLSGGLIFCGIACLIAGVLPEGY